MTTIQGRVVSRYDMTLKTNGMNNGYGYFLAGTRTPLDGMFLGLTRNDVTLSLAETNMNRRSLNLPEITTSYTQA